MVEVSRNPEIELVPIALIAVEVGQTVDQLAHHFRGEVLLDDIGMRAVPSTVALEFFAARWEQKKKLEAEAKHRAEKEAAETPPVHGGVPAVEGATPFESMVAAGVVSPSAEFGDREPPRFLEEELAAGRRAAEEAEAKAKQAAVDRMKEALR